jgi:hypothetical protein
MFITPPPSPKITLQAPTPGPASRALSNQNAVVDATTDNLLDDRKAVFYVLGFFTCFILWVLGFIYLCEFCSRFCGLCKRSQTVNDLPLAVSRGSSSQFVYLPLCSR